MINNNIIKKMVVCNASTTALKDLKLTKNLVFIHGDHPGKKGGHNTRIKDNFGIEPNYLNIINNLIENDNIVFLTGSSTGEQNIARFFGIKWTNEKGLHSNDYDMNGISKGNDLVNIIKQFPKFENFVIESLKRTPNRIDNNGRKYKAGFLSDVKNMFVAFRFNDLVEKSIVIEQFIHFDYSKKIISIRDNNDPRLNSIFINGNVYIINPEKINEFANEFNDFLYGILNKEISYEDLHEIDYLITDPGPPSPDGNEYTQDNDDDLVLELFNNKVKNIIISDEHLFLNKESKLLDFFKFMSLVSVIIIPLLCLKNIDFIFKFYLINLYFVITFVYIITHPYDKNKYKGSRYEYIIKHWFHLIDKVNLDKTCYSYVEGYNLSKIPEKFRKVLKILPSVGPTVRNTLMYKPFIKIFKKFDSNGFGVLFPPDERKNCYEYSDQIPLNEIKKVNDKIARKIANSKINKKNLHVDYITILKTIERLGRVLFQRNKLGFGGTPWAKEGEAGSIIEKDYNTDNASMSSFHGFFIISNSHLDYCNYKLWPSNQKVILKKFFTEYFKEWYNIVLSDDLKKEYPIERIKIGYHDMYGCSLQHLHIHIFSDKEEHINRLAYDKHIVKTHFL